MKNLRTSLAAILAAGIITASAFATDVTGKWTWAIQGPQGSLPFHAEFTQKGDTLTGTVTTTMGKDTLLSGSVKDDKAEFTLKPEFNGASFTVKYSGKIDGDKITGTIGYTTPDGTAGSLEWSAARETAEKAPAAKEAPPEKPKAN